MKHLILSICLITLSVSTGKAQNEPEYSIPITISSGSYSNTLYIGVHLGNTIGLDEDEALGNFIEEQLPPTPPPPYDFDVRLVTIPFRPSNYPDGLGTGVAKDYRGYTSPAQVDTFRIQISGSVVENGGATVAWPSDLSMYAGSWKIKGIAGTTLAETSMLDGTSVTLDAIFSTLQVLVIATNITVGVEQIAPVATGYELRQNFPNPFNPTTTITYSVPKSGHVALQVFDVLGQRVQSLVDEYQAPGTYKVDFSSASVKSGIYFYRLTSGSYTSVKKMIVLK